VARTDPARETRRIMLIGAGCRPPARRVRRRELELSEPGSPSDRSRGGVIVEVVGGRKAFDWFAPMKLTIRIFSIEPPAIANMIQVTRLDAFPVRED
jgi:hypothetical protein